MRGGPASGEPHDVADVVDLTSPDEATLPALEAAVEEHDVSVGDATDEEVHWLRPDADTTPDPHLDAPRLARLPEGEQRAALDAVLVLLAARGDAEVTPDGGVRWHGRHALLSALRYGAEAAASLRIDGPSEEPGRAAIYRITPRLFLTEEVDEPTGTHRFVLRSPTRQAAWVAAASDPAETATDTSVPERTDAPGAWRERIDGLARAARTTALLQVASAPQLEEPPRTLTFLGCADGLWVLQGYGDDANGQASLQRLGPTDLGSLCLAALAGERPAS
jgi:hypothetical protein